MININKIWGTRRRIQLDSHNEIDLLHIKKNYFCSTHTHDKKINKFIVVEGAVRIETEYGSQVLRKNDSWVVEPPLKHRFIALTDSTMIEIAYTKDTVIDPDDINRESIGGCVYLGKEYTLDQLKNKCLLNLNNEK